MKTVKTPIIGLTGNYNDENGQQLLSMAYVQAVADNGGCPVVLPPIQDDGRHLDAMLDSLDALLFTGGSDFTPELLGEPLIAESGALNPVRDRFEMALIRKAMTRQMPILGICRGAQLMALACDGKLFQDLPSQFECPRSQDFQHRIPLLPHSQEAARDRVTHPVNILPDTLLSDILQENTFDVNSFHHQAVRSLFEPSADAPCEMSPAHPLLRVSAFAPDGVVEAVESAEKKPFLGVQWHPECLTRTQPAMNRLFRWLTDEAGLFRRTRELHARAVSFDAHCDVPMFYEGNYDIGNGGTIERGKIDFSAKGDERLDMVRSRVDLQKMKCGAWDAIVAAAYIKQLNRDSEGFANAFRKADRLLDETIRQVRLHESLAGLARTPEEIRQLKSQGRRAVVLGVENGYALGRDLSNVEHFADKGIVYLTLCHNGHNDICDSASEQLHPEHNGVSPFGREVIAALNRRGVMVDLSHASEQSFWDAIECSNAPIICSHSSVRSLCEHRRNLKDDQIRALAAKGGLMGICLYEGFLTKGKEATIDDVIAHIHYVRNLVGIDYVGIGSDFDGGGGIRGCNSTAELFNISRALLREGYTPEEVSKVMGGNFLRVMERIQKAGAQKRLS